MQAARAITQRSTVAYSGSTTYRPLPISSQCRSVSHDEARCHEIRRPGEPSTASERIAKRGGSRPFRSDNMRPAHPSGQLARSPARDKKARWIVRTVGRRGDGALVGDRDVPHQRRSAGVRPCGYVSHGLHIRSLAAFVAKSRLSACEPSSFCDQRPAAKSGRWESAGLLLRCQRGVGTVSAGCRYDVSTASAHRGRAPCGREKGGAMRATAQ